MECIPLEVAVVEKQASRSGRLSAIICRRSVIDDSNVVTKQNVLRRWKLL
jgi:hypothetical protein